MATKKTKKATVKKVARRLKQSEISGIEKSLRNAISSCTKIIDKKDTIVLIDGTDAKYELKRLRSILQSANDKFGWNIRVKAL